MSMLTPMIPEIILAVTLALTLLGDTLDIFRNKRYLIAFAGLGVVASLYCNFLLIPLAHNTAVSGGQLSLFTGAFIADPLSIFFKAIFLTATFLVLLSSSEYIRKNTMFESEYYPILLTSCLGMMFLVSAGEMITLFIALELTTLPLYMMVTFQKGDARSAESGIKYYLIGSLSSAILLYGMSLLYGLTGTTSLYEISARIHEVSRAPLTLSLVFITAGLAFKIGAVPFHMWVPDVYMGAPTPVTAFLSVGSKAAGFAILMRFVVISLEGAKTEWSLLMAVLAAMSIILGNLVAIHQTEMKRFLAYSSIAQAGYILVAVPAASTLGNASIIFFLLTYLFTNLCAFIVAIFFTNTTGSDKIEHYAGLSQRSPVTALCMLIALLSLAGIPPLAGFAGKFFLFAAAYEAGYLWLVVIGVLMSVVSVYYYLMIVYRMYIESPKEPGFPKMSWPLSFALAICMAGILGIGVFPDMFIQWALESVRFLDIDPLVINKLY